jgi:hypothetical protein
LNFFATTTLRNARYVVFSATQGSLFSLRPRFATIGLLKIRRDWAEALEKVFWHPDLLALNERLVRDDATAFGDYFFVTITAGVPLRYSG